MSDHPAKRQRLTGSFSPASPPYHQVAKPRDQTKPVVHPHTPTSPPYSSMNSHANDGSGMSANAPASEMTPPSSVHMSQPVSQTGAQAPNAPPFTPGSMTGAAASNPDSDGDAMMVDSVDHGTESGDHRHSNHDRQRRAAFADSTAGSGDPDGAGSQLFQFRQSSHPMSRPHGSQNLFELYGLSDLARSVARTDPITGEKINKLRKSYEGHIKALHIAGKPKAVKMEGPKGLMYPLGWPDEEYQIQRVNGKEFHTAIDMETKQPTAAFDALMSSAFGRMAPGPLPPADAARFRAYLATDEASKAKAATEAVQHRGVQSASAAPTPVNPAVGPRASRPERSGAKRSYTDVSFQGYGEGFADEGEDDGEGGVTKKRRLGFERTSHSVEVGGVRAHR